MAMSVKTQAAKNDAISVYSTKWGCIIPRIRHPSDEKPREMRGYTPLGIISASYMDPATSQRTKHNYHSVATVLNKKPEELFVRPSEEFGAAYLDIYVMLPLIE
ncbi:MAG TPA: hypothetical protein VJH90_03730 [archaeon]|nr:hypothetical protein [archaeon]